MRKGADVLYGSSTTTTPEAEQNIQIVAQRSVCAYLPVARIFCSQTPTQNVQRTGFALAPSLFRTLAPPPDSEVVVES